MISDTLQDAVMTQRESERRRSWMLFGFGLLLIASFILDIMTGPSMIDVTSVLHALLEWIGLPFRLMLRHK
ncbi:hypothetical protein ACT691_05045 [Vibrio metschnikovii]